MTAPGLIEYVLASSSAIFVAHCRYVRRFAVAREWHLPIERRWVLPCPNGSGTGSLYDSNQHNVQGWRSRWRPWFARSRTEIGCVLASVPVPAVVAALARMSIFLTVKMKTVAIVVWRSCSKLMVTLIAQPMCGVG